MKKGGATDSKEYLAASDIHYERHVYAGNRPVPPAECKGAPESQLIYEYMWGPREFFAT